MEAFVVTLSFLVIGMLLRRVSTLPDTTGQILNQFVIFVSLPALVALRVPELPFSSDLLVPALLPWVMVFFSAALVLLLSRTLKWDRATTGCLLLMAPLGNTSFLGVPMVRAFFGDQAVSYALLYDQLGSFPAVVIYGSLIVAAYAAGGVRPSAGSIVRRIVTFPPFIALVIAFAVRGFGYPPVVTSLLQSLSATLVPLVMIAVGYQLTLRLSRSVASQLGVGLSIKLVAAPLAALYLCKLLGFQGEAMQVSVFEAGMPPMVVAGMLAISANLVPALTSAMVGIGILASFVTLPLLHQLLV
jgi:malate permease and related proteins